MYINVLHFALYVTFVFCFNVLLCTLAPQIRDSWKIPSQVFNGALSIGMHKRQALHVCFYLLFEMSRLWENPVGVGDAGVLHGQLYEALQ